MTPVSGVCLKTDAKGGEKVFINLCRSEHIPPPPSVSDIEMAHALATGDNSTYRIPMSVGEPHAELDTAKKGCTAYDVIVSEAAFSQFQAREGIKEFMVELILCHIEVKHTTQLSRDYKILGKRTRMGQLQQQRIRRRTTIQEVNIPAAAATPEGPPDAVAPGRRPRIEEVGDTAGDDGDVHQTQNQTAEIPQFTLLKEPEEGRPEFYILELELPKVGSAATMTLDVGGNRLELTAHPRKYFLGLDFDYPVDYKETGAQFNKKTKQLTVTLPVRDDTAGHDE